MDMENETTDLTLTQKAVVLAKQHPYILGTCILLICIILFVCWYGPSNVMAKASRTCGGGLSAEIERVINSIKKKQAAMKG